jgi:hypothetical protein
MSSNVRHATIGVVVERCKSIVDVFWSSGETQPVEHFIHHVPKKKISLKTLAQVLGIWPVVLSLTAGHFSKANVKKPQDAGESIQIVENLVNYENAMEFSPMKRRFEEVDSGHFAKVKTERSMSTGSSLSGTTYGLSVGIKMEVDAPSSVDEETSKAASILNGVAMDHRMVHISLNAK